MDYRILGRVDVWDGGRPIVLGGARPRALLALLLLHANQVVPTGRITEALWGEAPPQTAQDEIQTHLSKLGTLLTNGNGSGGGSVIVAQPEGYLIQVRSADVDLLRFEWLTAEARKALPDDPETAAGLLREALNLWRGPALDGVVFEGSARAEVDRLSALRLAALEDRLDCDLALGRHTALVGELEALVAANPDRKRLGSQLARARQGAAPSPVAPPPVAALPVAPAAGTAAPASATPAASPTAETTSAPQGRRRRWLVLPLAALVVAGGATGGLILHSRGSSSSSAGDVSPAAPFPTAEEKALIAILPPSLDPPGCRRTDPVAATAIADITCTVPPGAGVRTVSYQRFANYGDLESFFHHQVLYKSGNMSAQLPLLQCGQSPLFFGETTYPVGDEKQSEPTAHGHLYCWREALLPNMAWSNVGWLTVAEATGADSGPVIETGMLTFWRTAGPVGEPSGATTQDEARQIYRDYLRREPTPDEVTTMTDTITRVGYGKARNMFADSCPVRLAFSRPVLQGAELTNLLKACPAP